MPADFVTWCGRWGDAYPDDDARRAAYADAVAALAELRAVFGDNEPPD